MITNAEYLIIRRFSYDFVELLRVNGHRPFFRHYTFDFTSNPDFKIGRRNAF